MYWRNACMLRLTELSHHRRAVRNRLGNNLADCFLTRCNSSYTLLDKVILPENDLILFLSWFTELTRN